MSCPDQNAKQACSTYGSSGVPEIVPGVRIIAKRFGNEVVEVPWHMRNLAFILATYPDLKAYKAALAARVQHDFEEAQEVIRQMERIPGGYRDEHLNERLEKHRRAVMWGLCEMTGVGKYDFNRTKFGDGEFDRLISSIKDAARWVAPDKSGTIATSPTIAVHAFLADIAEATRRLLFNTVTGKVNVSIVMDDLDYDAAEKLLENGIEIPFDVLVKYPDLIARFGTDGGSL